LLDEECYRFAGEEVRITPPFRSVIEAAGVSRFSGRAKSLVQTLVGRSDRHLALERGDDRERRKEVRTVAGGRFFLIALQFSDMEAIVERPLAQL